MKRQPAEGGAGRPSAAGVHTRLPRALPPAAAALLAVGLASVGVLAVPGRASAISTGVMAADTVTALEAPPVGLAVPADGRVNGYGFTGQILGAATGSRLPGPDGLRAGAGQRLWVFGLRWQADPTPASPDPNSGAAVTAVQAAVVVDGQHITVPLTQPPAPTDPQAGADQSVDSGPEYFAASVPAAAPDVVVELSAGGYAQDFSLTHLARQGAQPAALYRNTGWGTVDQAGFAQDVPTPYNDGTTAMPDAALVVKVPTITLSYFGPDGTTDPAPTPGQAWLVPQLQDPPQYPSDPGHNLEYQANVTAADMALTIAGQAPIHPKTLPGGPDPLQPASDGSTDSKNEVFPYRYAFAVPAELTAATLTITFPPEPAVVAYAGGNPVTVHPAPLTIPITLPPPATITPPAGAATTPAVIDTTRPDAAGPTTAPTTSHHSSGSFPTGPTIAAIIAAAAIAAGILLYRRRRTTPPTGPATAPDPPSSTTSTPWKGGGTPPAPNGTTTSADTLDPNHPVASADPSPDVDGLIDGLDPHAAGLAPSAGNGTGAPAEPLVPTPEIPVFQPPEPPLLTEPAVRILGGATVAGWAEPPARTAVTQLVIYLAVHPDQPVPADTLLTALADGDTSRDGWLRSTASRARTSLGPGRMPDAGVTGGYQLHDVHCDWTAFQKLTTDAGRHHRAGQADQAINCYSQALALVTGPPFKAVDYNWIDLEGLRTHIETAVSAAAQALARLALTSHQPDLALWATRQARLANPLDETVAAAALTAAAATGRPGALRAEHAAITRDLAAHHITPSPQLDTHYHQLTVRPSDDQWAQP